MAPQLKACIALAEDLSLFPSTDIRQFIPSCNFNSRGSYPVFWLTQALYSQA